MSAIVADQTSLALDKPSNPEVEPFALESGRRELDRETSTEMPYDDSFKPSDSVEISDDALADRAFDCGQYGDAARRNIDRLASIFLPVRKHVAAAQRHLRPLMAATLRPTEIVRGLEDHERFLLLAPAAAKTSSAPMG